MKDVKRAFTIAINCTFDYARLTLQLRKYLLYARFEAIDSCRPVFLVIFRIQKWMKKNLLLIYSLMKSKKGPQFGS